MASVVVANAQEGADPSVPRRADGGLYRYEMIFGGFAARVYADSVTELCEHLIAGYAELDGDVAPAAARIEYAVRAQVQLQADIVARHGMEGCTPAERELCWAPATSLPWWGSGSPRCPWSSWMSITSPSDPCPNPREDRVVGVPRGRT